MVVMALTPLLDEWWRANGRQGRMSKSKGIQIIHWSLWRYLMDRCGITCRMDCWAW